MRVRISYGTDIGNVPKELQKLFSSVSEEVHDTSRRTHRIEEFLHEEDISSALSLIDKLRLSLGEIDARLADISNIAAGFVNYQENEGAENAGEGGPSLDTSGNGAESDWSSYFTRFDIRGFTVAAGNHDLNRSSNRMCAWGWKAGGAPTADNSQTSGAMTANSVSLDGFLQGAYTPSGSPSTYPKRMSIGTTQGFSIVQYVGNASNRTLPHGLGKAPKFMIVKNMETGSTGWAVYHDAIGHNSGDNYIEISDGQAGADNTAFQNTAPTTDLFSIGTKAAVNNDTDDTIAWIWADVPGLQKFGSYKGNANTDGVFVELGFRPAIVLVKNTGSSINWYMYDSARDRYNVGGKRVFLNTSANEATDEIDFLSNGFKWRDSGGGNSSSNVWLYAAWAAAPSINLYGALGEAR